jgi:hypothetical protein
MDTSRYSGKTMFYLPAVKAAIGLMIDPPQRQLLPPRDERTKTAYGCECGSTSLFDFLI